MMSEYELLLPIPYRPRPKKFMNSSAFSGRSADATADIRLVSAFWKAPIVSVQANSLSFR